MSRSVAEKLAKYCQLSNMYAIGDTGRFFLLITFTHRGFLDLSIMISGNLRNTSAFVQAAAVTFSICFFVPLNCLTFYWASVWFLIILYGKLVSFRLNYCAFDNYLVRVIFPNLFPYSNATFLLADSFSPATVTFIIQNRK